MNSQDITIIILDPHALRALGFIFLAAVVLVIDAAIWDAFKKPWLGKWKKEK